jgi:hypothetical protein
MGVCNARAKLLADCLFDDSPNESFLSLTSRGNSMPTAPRRNPNQDIGAGADQHPIAWGAIASLTATVVLTMAMLVVLIATL